MSIIFADSFDVYRANRDDIVDNVYEIGLAVTISTAQARHGTRSIFIQNGDTPYGFRRDLGANYTVLGVAAAYWFNEIPSRPNMFNVCELRSSANNIQFTIYVDPTGRIVARRTASDPVVAASRPVIKGRRWHHIEVRVKLSTTVGEVEVRVDEEVMFSLSGVNTQDDTLNSNIRYVAAGRTAPDVQSVVEDRYHVDDLVIWSDAGSVNNTFIGDRAVRALRPEADTSQADLTIVGVGAGYAAISDETPDDESTYVVAEPLAGSTEEQSEFTFGNVPSEAATIEALVVQTRVRNTEGGTVNLQHSLMSGASLSAGPDRGITSSDWAYYFDIHELDPATSLQWTPSGVNAAQLRLART